MEKDLITDIAATTQLKQGQAIEFLSRVLVNPESVTDLQLFAAEQLLRLYPEDTALIDRDDFKATREMALHTLSNAMNGFHGQNSSPLMEQRRINAAALICNYLSFLEGDVHCLRDDEGGSHGFLS